jgi:hypothetical protein
MNGGSDEAQVTAGGKTHRLQMFDLSEMGVRITPNPGLQKGSAVTVDVGDGPVQATAIWASPTEAGLSFEQGSPMCRQNARCLPRTDHPPRRESFRSTQTCTPRMRRRSDFITAVAYFLTCLKYRRSGAGWSFLDGIRWPSPLTT